MTRGWGSAKDELLTMVVDEKATTVEKFPVERTFRAYEGRCRSG
jgi:hypothetical protein